MSTEASSVCLACTIFLSLEEKDIHQRTIFHQRNILTYEDQNEYIREKSFIVDLSRTINVLYICQLCGQNLNSYYKALCHLTAFHDPNSSHIKFDQDKPTDIKYNQHIISIPADELVQKSTSNPCLNSSKDVPFSKIIQDASIKTSTTIKPFTTFNNTSAKCGDDCRKPKSLRNFKDQPQSIKCETCHITCLGEDIYNSHIAGRRHRKNAEANIRSTFASSPKINTCVTKSKMLSYASYFCVTCKIACTSLTNWYQHVTGIKHLSRLASTIHEIPISPVEEQQNPVSIHNYSPFTTDYWLSNDHNKNQDDLDMSLPKSPADCYQDSQIPAQHMNLG